MIGIVRLALRRPYTFVVMALLILIFGTASALRTPTDIFPNINIPVISVVFTYTGLPADDMAGRVVTFYERSLPNAVNDVEHIESQSIANYGIIKIFFQPTVNINAALAQVNGMSQTVLKQMPPSITPPLILSFNASSVPILQVALSSDKLSETEIFDDALNYVRPALAPVPGAALPLPFGGKVRQVQADLNQQALHQYGVSANDVINALSLQNLIVPVGTQKIGTYEYTVNLNDSPTAVKAFNDLPIKTVNGTVIYMRDVAYVHDGNPPQTNAVHVNGASTVLLTIVKAGATSTLDIINGVKNLLPSISQTLPASLKLTAVGDQSVYVTDAVSSVIREGVIAAALTGVMILLFLGSWRSTLIITISIPLAILAALTGLSLLGETINVMTLGGLALAVGILVDDATVTIENINRHLEEGKEIKPAILDGAQQIIVPATVSLFCISIAFVPMFWLGGVAGFLFRPLAEAVILALAASYVLSQTLVPTLANHLLRSHGQIDDGTQAKASRNPLARFQHGFEIRFENLRKAYLGLLQLALQNRIKLIAGFLCISLLSLGLAPSLGQDFFPAVDGGQIKLHIRTATGTRFEVTTALTDRIAAATRGIIPPSELDGVVSNIGLTVSGINMAYNNSGTIGVGDADILISLRPHHAPTDNYVKTMRERLPQQFPGTTFAFLPADIVSQVLNFGAPAPIDLQVAGRDLAADRKYANSLLAKVREIPGIADARIQQAFAQPTLDVNVDRSLTSLAGLSDKDIANAMLTTLSGSSQSAPTYWLDPTNGVSYAVSVQTPQRDINTMSGLKNIPITSPSANTQLLGGLANVERTNSNAVVSHYNVQPVIDIYATPQGRDLGALASDIQKLIHATARQLPKGASVTLRGQVTTMTSAYRQLYVGLAAAIVLIYLLIVVNFQSWADPFVIIMALPTALAGIVWILFATGTTLSVPALTGAIMCMGVATANSILVISFARDQMAAGLDATTAAFEAGRARFRPVMMTALAMVVGMVPMAIEPGQNTPLGRAVIGGLIFATCATLVLVPAIFSLVHSPQHGSANQPAAATAL
jgi:multidrug efflux pump subunit AcrB